MTISTPSQLLDLVLQIHSQGIYNCTFIFDGHNRQLIVEVSKAHSGNAVFVGKSDYGDLKNTATMYNTLMTYLKK